MSVAGIAESSLTGSAVSCNAACAMAAVVFGPRGKAAVMIAHLVARDRPEPTAETVARPVAMEIGQVQRDAAKDFLHHVSGVLRLQARLPRPAIDQRGVNSRQAPPGVGVVRDGPCDQARRGRARRVRRWR